MRGDFPPLVGSLAVGLRVRGRQDEERAIEVGARQEVVAEVEEVCDALGGWVEVKGGRGGVDAMKDLFGQT